MAQPTRASTSRVASQRALNRGEYRGKLHIDPARVPTDKRYLWVRETVVGQSDSENVSDRMVNGWHPVPSDRHPEMMPLLLEGQSKSPYIRRGGQILMEKPLLEWEAEQADLRRETAETLASVDHDRQRSGDKNFVPTAELSSRVERNGRFEEG